MAAISTHPATYGQITYLSEDVSLGQLGARSAQGDLVMFGTRAEVEGVATRLRLGQRELEQRAARRRMQRESRRRNR